MPPDPFDPFKYIKLGGDPDKYLSLGGSIRERYEYTNNPVFGDDSQDENGVWLQRANLHADMHLGGHAAEVELDGHEYTDAEEFFLLHGELWPAYREHRSRHLLREVTGLIEGGHEVKDGELGAIAIKLPLPPGTLPPLWQAQQRFLEECILYLAQRLQYLRCLVLQFYTEGEILHLLLHHTCGR